MTGIVLLNHAMDALSLSFQIIIILVSAHILGRLCEKLGQPRVVGEILAGIVLGPTLLGDFMPEASQLFLPDVTLPTIDLLGQFGLILFIFMLGAEQETGLMRRDGWGILAVTIGGIFLSMILVA